MDLISREAAIEAMTNYAKFLWDNYHETCNLAGMIDTIEALPTAEKVGKWAVREGELAFWDVCDQCGKKILHRTPFYNFCPNCGARMRGEEDE